jgi:hypothetical protein
MEVRPTGDRMEAARRRVWRLAPAVAVASMLLITPGGAFAHLGQPDQGDTSLVHACVGKVGTVRIIDGATQDCKLNQTRAHWPLVGPQGQPGTPGAPGAPGLPGEAGIGILGGSTGGVLLGGLQDQFVGAYGAGRSRAQVEVELPIPTGSTLSNFYVLLSGPSGTGKAWTFVVRNGNNDTAVTCTIQNLATSCSDLTNSAVFAPGDLFSIRVIGTGNPTQRPMQWTGMIQPD